jgi:hypothetical protein
MAIGSTIAYIFPIILCINNAMQAEVIKPMSNILFEVHFNFITHVFHYDFICF